MIEPTRCLGCGYVMLDGHNTAYQLDTELCGWCRSRGLFGKEADPKVETKMNAVISTLDPVHSTHRWRCLCCDLVKTFPEMDTSWRWSGVTYEHKCEVYGQKEYGYQAGYFDCVDIDKKPGGLGVGKDAQLDVKSPAGHPEFHRIIDEMRAMHERKAADYGSGQDPLHNVRSGGEFVNIPAWQAAVLRMNDKMVRIASFIKKGKLENEGVEDSLQDIAAYAIIALVLIREAK